jgi:c-di-GMP-binding flagellar brake protein YcgR
MRELEINQKIEIEILSGLYQGNYLSKVADFLDDNILVTGLYREGSPLPVRLGQQVSVYYTTDRAAFKFETEVLKRTNEPIPLLLLAPPDSTQRIQRRDYFRLDATGIVYLYKNPTEVDYPVKIAKARMLDISGGGVKVELERDLKEGDEFLVTLKDILPKKTFISAKIVRKDKVNDSLYNYGVEFTDLKDEQREEIIQWIFTYQRKSRKKGLR